MMSTFEARSLGEQRLRVGIDPAPASTVEAMMASSGRRVLIADADVDAAGAITTLLASQGHNAQAVDSMTEALALAGSFQPHLALVNLARPQSDTLAGVRELRRSRRGLGRVWLVAIGGTATDRTRADAHAAGFDVVLPYPVDAGLLCEVVQGLLDTRALDARADDPLEQVLLR